LFPLKVLHKTAQWRTTVNSREIAAFAETEETSKRSVAYRRFQ